MSYTRDCVFGVLADVAQLAEQLICNQQVAGSSPIIGSNWILSFNL